MILGIDHVQLAMPAGEETAARAFYGDLLGMQEIPKPAPLRASGGVWFVGGGTHLHLGVQTPFVPAQKAHPALLVSDITALKRRLTEAGIAIVKDERLPSLPRFYARDPFGNRLEFIETGSGFSQ